MRVNIMKKILVAICLMCSTSVASRAAEVVVAAASDLGFAVKEIITDFERETGNKVRLSLGSSGTFAAQILNSAPFDVFLSADIAYPQDSVTSLSVTQKELKLIRFRMD
jgi:molybdate transport system substrate-binding protein